MRALLLLGIVLAGVWMLRSLARRIAAPKQPPASPPAASQPITMVRCAQCGVHLPEQLARPLPHGGLGCPEHSAPKSDA